MSAGNISALKKSKRIHTSTFLSFFRTHTAPLKTPGLLPGHLSVMRAEIFLLRRFFPYLANLWNNCQCSNMRQQHCTARNNAGFWGSLSQRFGRRVLMDVAAVMERSTAHRLPLSLLWQASRTRGGGWMGLLGICAAPVWQTWFWIDSAVRRTHTVKTSPTAVCSTLKSKIKSQSQSPSISCTHSPDSSAVTPRWSLLGSGQICLWSIIAQPLTSKGQTSSRSFPASGWMDLTCAHKNENIHVDGASKQEPLFSLRATPKVCHWGLLVSEETHLGGRM